MNNEDRTNNHAEAANRRLQYELGMNHPTIWKFIDTMRKVQKERDAFLENLTSEFEHPQKLKQYCDADQRIKKLVFQVKTLELIKFFRGVAIIMK